MDEERTVPVNTAFPEEDIPAQLPVLPEESTQPSDPVPPDAEEIPGSPPQKANPARRAFRITLTRILPAFLIVTAVTVYAVLAVTSVREADFTAIDFLQNILGEFNGGADSVLYTTASAAEEPIAVLPELPPETEISPEPMTSPPETIYAPETVPFTADFPLYRLDMSSSAPHSLGLINETPYEPDLYALSEAARAIPTYAELAKTYGSSAPVVLILHTHTTEAFADTSADDFRSTDSLRNITAVGSVIAGRLTENGIPVLHCTETFDAPDFNMAYYNAALAIRKYIEEYPSISYVLDIHRDSIVSGDGWVSPVTQTGGSSAAQMMFVVGTDHGGSGHTGWQDNLALAARLQKSLSGDCPTLMRDISLRSASFNAQYTSGSLLVEIGSCASTLDEAKTAAERFADHLAREILGN
ncbi:MAG: stage II sporulation protein P [Clostridia bacterium]|nr:stage II sporulation protein P [Clostridia bacterium]